MTDKERLDLLESGEVEIEGWLESPDDEAEYVVSLYLPPGYKDFHGATGRTLREAIDNLADKIAAKAATEDS